MSAGRVGGAKPPEMPTDFTIGFKDGSQLPVGYVVIDPLSDNIKNYRRIAKSMRFSSEVISQPLWLTFIDFEYGIQDNVQHTYDEVRPYMRSEPFRFYAGSSNMYLEMMVRFFAFKSARTDVHAKYEFVKALQYPWIDIQSKYKYPPPKLIISLNYSLRKVGYITAMNTTWFSPVGYEEAEFLGVDTTKFGNRKYSLVNFYCEALMTFTVVGNWDYNMYSIRNLPSANSHFENYDELLRETERKK